MNKPENLCLAPWTHTYLSPQTERRLCCASREPAQNFKQYIDTKEGTNEYNPQTLEEYWNGENIRRIRMQMLNNEVPPECVVCDKKLLNNDVYRDYFTHLFAHKWEDVIVNTDYDGYTSMKPVSWDYRFSNLCNFKCRMCGPMLSSSWETEARKQGKIEPWMEPSVKKSIENFQSTVVEEEFSQAVEEHRIEEIYWVGGEPLMYEQHWKYMQRIIELGDGQGLYARYNTNLSRVSYKGIDLYDDILSKIRDWQICASIDGTGAVGEYIRTGLKYNEWLEYFKRGIKYSRNRRMMRIDFTLTTPGLFELENICKLSDELGVDILAKVVFAFDPTIAMSPLFLPRDILDAIIDKLLTKIGHTVIVDMLNNLRNRPTFEQEYPDTYLKARSNGKNRINKMDKLRGGMCFEDTLRDSDLLNWWRSIDAVD
jgi:sulfatase maturation enzyme AslB (radical SAM superfamily)|tara:strand:+ start:520 stop:1797 length:1278 start_codon:yes stop_codon:yes gene_type:complete